MLQYLSFDVWVYQCCAILAIFSAHLVPSGSPPSHPKFCIELIFTPAILLTHCAKYGSFLLLPILLLLQHLEVNSQSTVKRSRLFRFRMITYSSKILVQALNRKSNHVHTVIALCVSFQNLPFVTCNNFFKVRQRCTQKFMKEALSGKCVVYCTSVQLVKCYQCKNCFVINMFFCIDLPNTYCTCLAASPFGFVRSLCSSCIRHLMIAQDVLVPVPSVVR